jgi:hypothetical protein
LLGHARPCAHPQGSSYTLYHACKRPLGKRRPASATEAAEHAQRDSVGVGCRERGAESRRDHSRQSEMVLNKASPSPATGLGCAHAALGEHALRHHAAQPPVLLGRLRSNRIPGSARCFFGGGGWWRRGARRLWGGVHGVQGTHAEGGGRCHRLLSHQQPRAARRLSGEFVWEMSSRRPLALPPRATCTCSTTEGYMHPTCSTTEGYMHLLYHRGLHARRQSVGGVPRSRAKLCLCLSRRATPTLVRFAPCRRRSTQPPARP